MKPVYISRRAERAASIWLANDWLHRWLRTGAGITIGIDNFLHPWTIEHCDFDKRLWWELRVTPGLPAAVCDLLRMRQRWNPTVIPPSTGDEPEQRKHGRTTQLIGGKSGEHQMSIRHDKITAFVDWAGTVPASENITTHPQYSSYAGDFTKEEVAAAANRLRRIAEAEFAEAAALEREIAALVANDDESPEPPRAS